MHNRQRTPQWRTYWAVLPRKRRLTIIAVALLCCLFPIRQSALAPAEIISLDAQVVAAPLDGVIANIAVRPNQPVKAGDLLFSLDDTTLRNRQQVLRRSVQVADAELLAATQKAFDQAQSKGEVAQLNGRAHERRAELAAVEAQLERIQITAPHDGVAVFADPDEWQGKPVVTGERIMLLANPNRPGISINLPVADAVSMEAGAPLRLFLTVHPLTPLSGQIVETGYQALPGPDGVTSYRLRASFDADQSLDEARIGLKGTARIEGQRVILAYYLLRRPLAALREWSGF